MPSFGTPFSGNISNRKLTNEELVRAIRFMIASEYEAVQLYNQLAQSIDDDVSIRVLTDIANEERTHAGEFLRLLFYLSEDEKKFYDDGKKEVEEIIGLGLKKEGIDYTSIFNKVLTEWKIDSPSGLNEKDRKDFFNTVSSRLKEEKRKRGEID